MDGEINYKEKSTGQATIWKKKKKIKHTNQEVKEGEAEHDAEEENEEKEEILSTRMPWHCDAMFSWRRSLSRDRCSIWRAQEWSLLIVTK